MSQCTAFYFAFSLSLGLFISLLVAKQEDLRPTCHILHDATLLQELYRFHCVPRQQHTLLAALKAVTIS